MLTKTALGLILIFLTGCTVSTTTYTGRSHKNCYEIARVVERQPMIGNQPIGNKRIDVYLRNGAVYFDANPHLIRHSHGGQAVEYCPFGIYKR